MNEKGRNILPMIGFILIVSVLMGGFALARGLGKNGSLSNNGSPGKNTERSSSKTISIPIGGYNIDETGNASTNGMNKILITAVSSEINIETHSSSEVEAHFYGKVKAINNDVLPYLEVTRDGKSVIVRVVYPNTMNISTSGQTWLDVKVPENWEDNFEVVSVSGSINAPTLNGEEIQLSTTSGGVKVENISGDNVKLLSTSGSFKLGKLIIRESFEKGTVSGSFEAENLKADEAKLDSVSGSTTIRNADVAKVTSNSISGSVQINMQEGSAEMSTSSGEIAVSFEQGFESFSANSISGSVKLEVPENAGFRVKVDTVSGGINCEDFSLKVQTSKENHLEAEAGDGDGSIEVQTTSGSVNIKKR